MKIQRALFSAKKRNRREIHPRTSFLMRTLALRLLTTQRSNRVAPELCGFDRLAQTGDRVTRQHRLEACIYVSQVPRQIRVNRALCN